MSKYTTELRYIIENEKQFPPSEGQLSLKSVLENYPLYVESYKDVTSGLTINRRNELNEKILNHYYFREIGFETVNMFLFKFQSKMNNIMKYYNQMYKSVDYEFNPLWNVDMTETFEHEVSGSGSTLTNGTNTQTLNTTKTDTLNTTITDNLDSLTTNTNTNDGINVESDTPQSGVTEQDILSNTYASKTNHGKGTSTNTNDVGSTNTQTNTGTNTQANTGTNTDVVDSEINVTDSKSETFTRREFGSSKGYTFAQNIDQWRSIMVNVDTQIVEELNDLFMQVW